MKKYIPCTVPCFLNITFIYRNLRVRELFCPHPAAKHNFPIATFLKPTQVVVFLFLCCTVYRVSQLICIFITTLQDQQGRWDYSCFTGNKTASKSCLNVLSKVIWKVSGIQVFCFQDQLSFCCYCAVPHLLYIP